MRRNLSISPALHLLRGLSVLLVTLHGGGSLSNDDSDHPFLSARSWGQAPRPFRADPPYSFAPFLGMHVTLV